jgi:uncharacterized surface protein with fasciclin (FAS1) repeats
MKRISLLLLAAFGLVVAGCSTTVTPSATIADLVESYGELDTLQAALGTLEGENPFADPDAEFTVFAPTNEGFGAFLEALNADLQAAVDAGWYSGFRGITLDEIGMSAQAPTPIIELDAVEITLDTIVESGCLLPILPYHVAPVALEAADVVAADGQTVATLFDDVYQYEPTLTVDASDGVALVDALERSTNVIATDYLASNGVVHFIDGVLLPPAFWSGPEEFPLIFVAEAILFGDGECGLFLNGIGSDLQ